MKWTDRCGIGQAKTQMRIRRIFQTTFLTFTLTISVQAQEIGSKNLIRPLVALTASQTEEMPQFPSGCSKMGTGFADGVTLDEDNVPRKIRVELVDISTTKLAIGSEVVA